MLLAEVLMARGEVAVVVWLCWVEEKMGRDGHRSRLRLWWVSIEPHFHVYMSFHYFSFYFLDNSVSNHT